MGQIVHVRTMINLKSKKLKMPQKRSHRLILGWALMFGGIFGFMPIAGFWMLPLGLAVLSVDSPRIRRQRRRLVVWWMRRKTPKTGSIQTGPFQTEAI
jgi:hypothetical protein